MRLNVKQIAAYTGGQFVVEPIDAARLACGLSWDSRDIHADDVYVALPGERVDGHDFVAAALAAGASAVLVMQPLPEDVRLLASEMGAAVIEVADTAHAVTDLARAWRGHLRGCVVGVTGSVGKTTTKNLVRDVLSRRFTVAATAGNQNNELGAPKTVLSADADTQMVVVEMGMCALGEIASLCEFARPHWGVIVNVGESHMEQLGSRDNIARAKVELFQALPEGAGRAFVNAADDYADFVRSHALLESRRVQTVLFDGADGARARCLGATPFPQPAVWAEDVSLDDEGRPCFTLHASGFAVPGAGGEPAEACARCRLALRGTHNVANACAAAAVGLSAGMALDEVAAGLAESQPEAGRQEVVEARGGFTVINDAYNASPESMRAALSMFCAMDVRGRRVAVLGDMGELGGLEREGHLGVGAFAAGLPIERLVCVGERARLIAEAARTGGMPAERIVCARGVADVLCDLDAYLEPKDAVLVKASHFMGLERVVEGLVA